MRSRKHRLFILFFIFSSAVLTACSIPTLISDLFMDDPDIDVANIEIIPGPNPSMSGVWQDPEFGDIFIINWENDKYVVDSVYWKQEVYPIVDQLWSNGILLWMYFDSYLEEMVTFETVNVSQDKLLVRRIAEDERLFELERIK